MEAIRLSSNYCFEQALHRRPLVNAQLGHQKIFSVAGQKCVHLQGWTVPSALLPRNTLVPVSETSRLKGMNTLFLRFPLGQLLHLFELLKKLLHRKLRRLSCLFVEFLQEKRQWILLFLEVFVLLLTPRGHRYLFK